MMTDAAPVPGEQQSPAPNLTEARNIPKAHAVATVEDVAPARIIIDLKPAELTAPYKSYTSAQADALTALYIGKWMHVSGPMRDAQSFGSFMQVTLEDTLRLYDVGVIYLYFSEEWFDRLSVLKRGCVITVLGKVKNVGSAELHLKDCELIGEA
jgi:hypothetical protein